MNICFYQIFFFFYCNLCVMVLGIVANVRFTFVLQYRQVVCVNLSSYKYNTATGYDEKKARQKKFFSVFVLPNFFREFFPKKMCAKLIEA